MRLRNVIIACAVCALVVAVVLVAWPRPAAVPLVPSPARNPIAPAPVPPVASPVPAAQAPAAAAMPSVDAAAAVVRQPHTLRVPPEFADFESWTSERQLNAVTDIQRNPHLSAAMREFLVDLASDSSRRAVLRNNAANALGIQDPPVPGWLGRLADQALDPAETPIWRDYALQHLSDQLVPRGGDAPATGDFIGSPDSGLDRQRYLAVLTAVASSKLTVAGTALLHLDRLSREHGVSIDQAQLHALVLRVLEDDAVDVGAKVTAFGILGMQKNPVDADIPRRFLRDPHADVRRAAVAALGHLGTSDDIPAIEAVDVGGDRSVEMAKAAACKRLAAR